MTEGFKAYTELQERIDCNTETQTTVTDKFREIKNLSIVSSEKS